MITTQFKEMAISALANYKLVSKDGKTLIWNGIEITPVECGGSIILKVTLINNDIPVSTFDSPELKFGDSYTLKDIDGRHRLTLDFNV